MNLLTTILAEDIKTRMSQDAFKSAVVRDNIIVNVEKCHCRALGCSLVWSFSRTKERHTFRAISNEKKSQHTALTLCVGFLKLWEEVFLSH